MQRQRRRALGALPVLLLTACGGGGGGEAPAAPPGPPSPALPPAPPAGSAAYGNLSRASVGVGASLQGAVPFPPDNPWNTDISAAEVDPASDRLIASIGADKGLYRDFGAGLWEGAPIGIPYQVVTGQQARVPIEYQAYGDESDPGPFPIPLDAPVEGAPGQGGDRHVLVIDKDNQRLYELGRAFVRGGGWRADVGAEFHLDSNNVRPAAKSGWTSADAAGLPIFPGLARYDEASRGAGGIRHALRFTAARTRRAFVPPATHYASSSTDANLPPMGMRVRLKAGFAIPATFSPEAQAILTALKTYGMFLADNGSDWYLSGAPDDRWDNDRLRAELASVKGRDLEVVKMVGLVTQV
ncbi:hypothetical protein [Acidovorax sp. sic0104]|uniref:hypothetical protein n=1 Tax=Acidovorax sp. sic0104 TaxID=2854784 RepID=UPI0021044A05|nr:hypothetical protein [Acidovorax sp. sic0104]